MRAVAVALLLAPGCVHLSYQRERINEPIADAVVAGLRPGEADLGAVIERLGAPAIVWPSLNGVVVMAYAWQDGSAWGLSVSYAPRQLLRTSVDWDSEHAEVPAIVLEFDPDLRLQIVRRGLLRDIAPVPLESQASAVDVLQTYR